MMSSNSVHLFVARETYGLYENKIKTWNPWVTSKEANCLELMDRTTYLRNWRISCDLRSFQEKSQIEWSLKEQLFYILVNRVLLLAHYQNLWFSFLGSAKGTQPVSQAPALLLSAQSQVFIFKSYKIGEWGCIANVDRGVECNQANLAAVREADSNEHIFESLRGSARICSLESLYVPPASS